MALRRPRQISLLAEDELDVAGFDQLEERLDASRVASRQLVDGDDDAVEFVAIDLFSRASWLRGEFFHSKSSGLGGGYMHDLRQ